VPPLKADEFAGPGVAHVGYGEYNQRNLLNEWANQLQRPISKAASMEVGTNRATAPAPDGSAGSVETVR